MAVGTGKGTSREIRPQEELHIHHVIFFVPAFIMFFYNICSTFARENNGDPPVLLPTTSTVYLYECRIPGPSMARTSNLGAKMKKKPGMRLVIYERCKSRCSSSGGGDYSM